MSVLAILLCSFAGFERAAAQPAAPAATLPDTANLDGVYLALGPVASAVYAPEGDTWDGGFGGELMLVRVQERAALGALGIAAGGVRFAQAGNGRLWADVFVGNERWLGIALGVSAGVTAEVGDVQAPRLGWQATVWGFAGVIPYVRIGSVEKSGAFVDAGIKITLPAVHWR